MLEPRQSEKNSDSLPNGKNQKKLLPLRQFAKNGPYSAAYLSILVNRKSLKARRVGRNFYTTQEWVNEYLDKHAQSKKSLAATRQKAQIGFFNLGGRKFNFKAFSPATAIIMAVFFFLFLQFSPAAFAALAHTGRSLNRLPEKFLAGFNSQALKDYTDYLIEEKNNILAGAQTLIENKIIPGKNIARAGISAVRKTDLAANRDATASTAESLRRSFESFGYGAGELFARLKNSQENFSSFAVRIIANLTGAVGKQINRVALGLDNFSFDTDIAVNNFAQSAIKSLAKFSRSTAVSLTGLGDKLDLTNDSILRYQKSGEKFLTFQSARSRSSLIDIYAQALDFLIPDQIKKKFALEYGFFNSQNTLSKSFEQPVKEVAGEKIAQAASNSSAVYSYGPSVAVTPALTGDTVKGDLNVSGTAKDSKPSSESGAGKVGLYVLGDSVLDGKLTVGGPARFNNQIVVTEGADLRQAIYNSEGNVAIDDDLAVSGDLTVNNLKVNDSSEFSGAVKTNDLSARKLTVWDDAYIQGNEIVGGDLTIMGSFLAGYAHFASMGIDSIMSARGLSAGSGGLSVGGPAVITGTLTLADDSGSGIISHGPTQLNDTTQIKVDSAGAFTVSDGSEINFTVNTTDNIITIVATTNLTGKVNIVGDLFLTGGFRGNIASTTAFTYGDGTKDNIILDTVNSILTLGYASTTDEIIVNGKQVSINTASALTALTATQSGAGNILDLYNAAGNVMTVVANGNVGIGTTSPNNLFEVDDLISFNNARLETRIGYQAGYNLNATYNTYVGYQAGYGATAGTANTGDYNSALGTYALQYNTTGQKNSAVGYKTLMANTSGYQNVAMGYKALTANIEGFQNIAIGDSALLISTSSHENVAIGYQSLRLTEGGSENVAIGTMASDRNTYGSDNAVLGYKTSYYNTTGNYNAAIGGRALYFSSTGDNNTALGYMAGRGSSGVSFSNNTLIGYQAGYGLSTGSNNVIIGYQTASTTTTGSNNIVIGYNVSSPSISSSNILNIGNLIFGTGLDGVGTTISSGNVGIGTTTPTALTHILQIGTGDAFRVDDVLADTSPFVIKADGNVGIGTASPSNTLNVQNELVNLSGSQYMVLNSLSAQPASNSTATFVASRNIVTGGATGLASNISRLTGTNSSSVFAGDGTLTEAYGNYAEFWHTGTGTTTNAIANYGLVNNANNNGHVVNAYGLYLVVDKNSGASNYTTSYGVYVHTNFGVKSDSSYSLYSPGTSVLYNAGNVGIGTTSPLAKLSVAGGGYFDGTVIASIFAATSSISAPYFIATSASATSTFAGGLAIETSGFVYDYSTNNVGIGTTAAHEKLEVTGNIRIANTGASTGPKLDLYNGYIASSPIFTMQGWGGTGTNIFSEVDSGAEVIISTANGTPMKIGTVGTQALSFYTGHSNRMMISGSGNVGIGTTSPGTKLQISGLKTTPSDTNYEADSGGIQFMGTNSTEGAWYTQGINFAKNGTIDSRTHAYIYGHSSSNATMNLVFGTSETERMRIDTTGNVGIGTTNPLSQLEIQGISNGKLTLSSASTTVAAGDSVGQIDFYTNDSSTIPNRTVATIKPIAESDYVGTDTAFTALTFWTHSGSAAAAERLRISGSGMVGIGVTPTQTLHVFNNTDNSATAVQSYTGGLLVQGVTTAANTYSLLKLGGYTDGDFTYLKAVSNVNNDTDLFFGNYSTGGTSGDRMVIKQNGNVGIGTTSPGAKLDVVGNIRLSSSASIANIVANQEVGALDFFYNDDSTGNNVVGARIVASTPTTWSTTPTAFSGDLRFYTRYSEGTSVVEQMRINGSGNVGIGTTSPGAKLDVSSGTANTSIINITETATLNAGNTVGGIIFRSKDADGVMYDVGKIYSDVDYRGGNSGYGLNFTSRYSSASDSFNNFNFDYQGDIIVTSQKSATNLFSFGKNYVFGRNTSNGSDSGYLSFAAVADETEEDYYRGAKINVYGNEHATEAGNIIMKAGQSGVFKLFAGTDGEKVRITTSGNVGIGTTSPRSLLQVAGPKPQLTLSDMSAGANSKHWFLSPQGGNLYIGTSSDALNATSTYLTINQSGNVGIGITNPATLLHVVSWNSNAEVARFAVSGGSGSVQGKVYLGLYPWAENSNPSVRIGAEEADNGDYGANIVFQTRDTEEDVLPLTKMIITEYGKLGLGITSPTAQFHSSSTAYVAGIFDQRGTSDILQLQDEGSSVFVVKDGGNVGIGTTTPWGKLSITQTGTGGAPSFIVEDIASPDATPFIIDQTGNVGIQASTTISALTVGGDLSLYTDINGMASIKFSRNTSGPGSYVGNISYNHANNNMGFVVNGDTRMQIDSNGNVGIGTTSPDSKLSVAYGDTSFRILDNSANAYLKLNRPTADRRNEFHFKTADVIDWIFGTSDSDNAGNGTEFFIGRETSGTNPALWIETSGYVGIGTTNPPVRLSVQGHAIFAPDVNSNVGAINIDSLGTDGAAQFHTYNGNGNIKNMISANGNSYFNGGNVGIGTSSPTAKLDIYSATPNPTDLMFKIASSTGVALTIQANGAVASDSAYSSAGADYAEYFKTADSGLKSGELVCVDVERDNTVKRCDRGHDNNVMGIVSTKPSIIGNNSREALLNPSGYAVVGMLGQVDAYVSAENGPIRVGDSLTPDSFRPGYAMRADGGDSTVGIALESKLEGTGKIKVLISRRNKSLAVEEVEKLVTDRVAAMAIEDEVNRMIAAAVEELNLDSKVNELVDPKLFMLSTELSVTTDDLKKEIINTKDGLGLIAGNMLGLAAKIDRQESRLLGLDSRIADLESSIADFKNEMASSTASTVETVSASFGKADGPAVTIITALSANDVAIMEIETASTTTQTAFVVNQKGPGGVADFRSGDVSIMNIESTGKVVIVGEMEVDGRILVCSSGACNSRLDAKVDDTLGDLGVEGKVVAGAYEGYCDEGFVWAPGSAEYGTLPGFCLMENPAKIGADKPVASAEGSAWTNLSQGQADINCQSLGEGYHLLSDAEWLTVAENITRSAANDSDGLKEGLQLASSSPAYALTNGNKVYGFSGSGEWTRALVNASDLPVILGADWAEYGAVSAYKSLGVIRPPYYLSDAENGIGKIMTGNSQADIRGYVRGAGGIFGLDLSHAPTEALAEVGFRCAK